MGLVEAAYQLRRLTHRIKIFAAIRKEAFEKLGETNPMVQQLRGSTVDMSYSRQSLREIFETNIRRERPRHLVDKSVLRTEPFAALLGFTQVRHTYTGEDEEIFNYIYRHTLGRPRDLMTIGGRLSRIPPAQRDPHTVMTEVNAAATEIAQEYLSEIAPLTNDLDLDVSSLFCHGTS